MSVCVCGGGGVQNLMKVSEPKNIEDERAELLRGTESSCRSSAAPQIDTRDK